MPAEIASKSKVPKVWIIKCNNCGYEHEVVSAVNLRFQKIPCNFCDTEEACVITKKRNR